MSAGIAREAMTGVSGDRAVRGACLPAVNHTPSDTASRPAQAYPLGWKAMATAPSEPLSQRLAAIRDQLKLLADYL